MKVLPYLICFTFLVLSLHACQKKHEMYEASPLAKLMREMHDYHQDLSGQFKEGKSVSAKEMPASFAELASLPMTEEHMRTEAFEQMAKHFLQAEKAFHEAKQKVKVEKHNAVVASCIACHETVGCTGPIPKIKKLYWVHPVKLNDSIQSN